MPDRSVLRRALKKPMAHRFFVMALVLCPSLAHAQRAITEDEAVRAYLAAVPIDALSDAAFDEQHGIGMTNGAWTNPELGYLREETAGQAATGEDYLYASQRIDLSGRTFVRRDAGDRRGRAARLEAEARRAELEAEVRAAFHRALAAHERELALAGWCQSVEAALSIVDRRQTRGDAAPYDALRLRRELRLATLRRDEARASYDGERARLTALVGEDVMPTGELRPSTDDASLARSIEAASAGPHLRSLVELEAAAQIDHDASSRAWVPDLLLGVGYKGVNSYGTGRADGFTLSIGFTLPIFDWGQGTLVRDEARMHVAQLSLEIETRTASAEAQALARELVQMLEALDAFEQTRVDEDESLVRAASAAYEGGEGTVLELLDAHRAQVDDALAAIDGTLAARLSSIELRRLGGGER